MEAVEALLESSRPLAARYAEAQRIEAEAQELFLRAAEVRSALEADLARRPVYAPPERLTGEMVRDAILKFPGGFTVSELAAECDAEPKEIRKFLEPMILGGAIRETGERFGRSLIYEYVPPANGHTPRIKRRPPEHDPPARLDSQATGEPVRVRAQAKITKKGRSTPGVGHRAKMTDLRYERAQAVARARNAVNEEKMRKDMEKLKGKKRR